MVSNARLAFLFFVVLWVNPGVAARSTQPTQGTCPNVDLSSRFGYVRDQGDANQCYAFVAADLIGYAQGLSPKQMVSAMDVAANYADIDPRKYAEGLPSAPDLAQANGISLGLIKRAHDNPNPFASALFDSSAPNGGYISMAIDAYNYRGGACTEQDLPSQTNDLFLNKDLYFNSTIARLGKVVYTSSSADGHILTLHDLSNAISEKYNLFECTSASRHDSLKTAKMLSDDLNHVVAQNIEKAIQEKCRNRIPLKPMTIATKTLHPGKSSPASSIIAKLLTARIPVSIGYDPSFLIKGPKAPHLPSTHGSILVGSRWNKKKRTCEFELRNSWGISCENLHKVYRKDCLGGETWISAADVNERVSELQAIDPVLPADIARAQSSQ